MKVKELLKILNKKLTPYAEFDVDNDWDWYEEINKKSLGDMLEECFEDTDITIHWRWQD